METLLKDLKDSIIDTKYDLVKTNAKELSNTLKQGVDVLDFITEKNQYFINSDVPKTVPLEIYEYQNFFLLKDGDDFVLLDGFRRLLFFETPDIDIQVRIYKRENLTDQQILKLLVMFNHTKFFGGIGKYFERGFSLALNKLFGLDVKKIYFPMDGYLKNSKTSREYSYESIRGKNSESEIIKDRITNKMFVHDMLFIQNLMDKNYMVNDIFGTLLYKFRTDNPDFELDVEKFVSIGDENTTLVDLHTKYDKYKDDQTYAKTVDVINKIVPLYVNIFYELIGKKPEKTLAECLDESKQMVNDLKKDKSLIKMTGNQKIYLIERKIREMVANNEPLEFVCIQHPKIVIENKYSKDEKKYISEYGPIDVKFLGFTETNYRGNEILIGYETDGKRKIINHNYGGWNSYGKKYTHIRYNDFNSDVDLFIKMDKSILKEK